MIPRLATALIALAFLGSACSSTGETGSEATPASTSTSTSTVEAGETGTSDPRAWKMADEYTAVLGRFVGVETAPVAGTDGKVHVVYELWLTNGRPVPASIEVIEAIDTDTDEVVATLEGDELLEATHELSTRPATDTDLDPNESALVFLHLDFETAQDVPDRLVHRLVGTGATNPGSREPAPIDYRFAPWDISQRTTPVIGAPLVGSGWVAVNGCCTAEGAHRGAVQTVNGTLFDSQRFAIDWMRVDDDGRFVGDGDPSDPASWNAYGEDVLAVGDGTVVEVTDDLDDQEPGSLPAPGSITLDTVDGNHVILDLGNGLYVFYAHLKPGSVQVEEGDTVSAGDVLAQVGNTGNTSAPHLHIHVMDRPSAIASDSIPYQFDAFELTGSVDADQWHGGGGSEEVALTDPFDIVDVPQAGDFTDALPLDLSVVTFAEAG